MSATSPHSTSFARAISNFEREVSFFGARFIANAELRRDCVDAARDASRWLSQGVRTGRLRDGDAAKEAVRVMERLRAIAQQVSADAGAPIVGRHASSLTERQDWRARELFASTYQELGRPEQARVDFEIVQEVARARPPLQFPTLGADRVGSPLLVASIAFAVHHILAAPVPPAGRTGLGTFVGGTLVMYLSVFGAPMGTGTAILARGLLGASFGKLFFGHFANHPLTMVRT